LQLHLLQHDIPFFDSALYNIETLLQHTTLLTLRPKAHETAQKIKKSSKNGFYN
jgi:hypothetical protein